MNMKFWLAGALVALAAFAATASGASTLLTTTFGYTSTDGIPVGGSFGSSYNETTHRTQYFANITVNDGYSYNLTHNCDSLAPGCGLLIFDNVPSQPFTGLFVYFDIDMYYFSGAASTPNVPFSFQDGIIDYSGDGTLTYATSVSSTPEPATWAMLLIGFGGLGAVMRMARRRNDVATAAS